MNRLIALSGCLLLSVLKLAGQAAVSYGGIGEPAIAPGDPSSSYALTGLDHINYYSGQVNLTIPVRSIGGRGSAADNIVIPIQRQWSVSNEFGSFVPDSSGWPISSGLYTSGFISLYTVSGNANQCVTYDDNGNPIGYSPLGPFLSYIVWTRVDGTQTILRDLKSNGQPQNAQVQTCGQSYTPYDRGTVFQSSDGTDLTFVASSDVYDGQGTPQGTLITRNGTKYSFSADTYVSSIEDHNGNQMQFAFSSTNNGGIYTVSDPVGRTETINFTEDLNTDTQDVITYPGTGGTARTITVNYALLQNALAPGESLQTYSQLFPELNGSSSTYFNSYVISSVVLADGTSYTIQYNAYGEPARLTLPTGGVYIYKYLEADGNANGYSGVVNLGNGNYSIYRRVQERDELSNGSTVSGKILFSEGTATTPDPNHPSQAATLFTATFEDGSGNVLRTEKHSFDGNPAPTNAPASNATQFADWWLGLEFQTEIDDPTAGMLQTQQRVFSQRGCPGAGESNCWYTPSDDASPSHDTQLASVTTTLGNGQESEITYAYDQYNNTTDEYDYDWGSGGVGGLLRHIQMGYREDAQFLNPSVNLVGLPYTTAIKNGANTPISYTDYEYDEYGSRALQDDPGIVGHDSAYNTGNATRGNLTTIWRSQDGSNNLNIIGAQYTYDIAGNVVAQYDGDGHETQIEYNDDGQNKYALPTSMTNALNQAAHVSYDYNIEKPATVTDANNAATNYTYNDPLDRLTQVQLANGGKQYYSYPSVTQVITQQDQASSGDAALKTQQLYDGLGRLLESDTFEGSSQYIATTQSYDALGRIAQTTNPSRPNDGLNYATKCTYDALGRVTQVQTADGAVTQTSYWGQYTTSEDAAGNKRVTASDGLGRMIAVWEDTSGFNYQTGYVYDANGNLVQVGQGTQNRYFTYDGLSRLTAASNPESGTTSYSYL